VVEVHDGDGEASEHQREHLSFDDVPELLWAALRLEQMCSLVFLLGVVQSKVNVLIHNVALPTECEKWNYDENNHELSSLVVELGAREASVKNSERFDGVCHQEEHQARVDYQR